MAQTDALGVRLTLREHFYKPFPDPLDLGVAVLKKGSPFPEVVRTLGMAKTVFIVAVMIDNFCKQFNLGQGKNMNQGQIEDLAGILVMDFTDRKGNAVMLEELAIFFDKAPTMKRKDGKPFIFDRIDRLVIEEMLDFYFENDRTQAVWKIEDDLKRLRTIEGPEPLARLTPEDDAPTVGDFYTKMAGKPGALKLTKLINEGLKKYGNQGPNDAGTVPGNDIG